MTAAVARPADVVQARVMRCVCVLLAISCLIGTTVASAAVTETRGRVQIKARKAANSYTNRRYGIGFPGANGWRHWSATCQAAGGRWHCSVRMHGGQCAGTVQILHDTLKTFARDISCSER